MLNIKENISLSEFTTFRIGGPAKFFVEVKNDKEISEAMDYAKDNDLEAFVLAGGSNLLISDEGFDGLVIRISNSEIKINENKITCGAGASLMHLVLESVKKNLTGLEWAAGIPGTVGGAVIGNAGAFGGEISDSLEEVEVFDSEKGELLSYKNKDCKFSYRESVFKENIGKMFLISVKFKLEKSEEGGIEKIEDIIKKRKEKQPQFPSAGSFFKNPIVNDDKIIENFEKDTDLKMKDDKVPAGWLVESAGLRGKKIGGAQVSEKHANFIINTGNATAEDVIMLSSLIKQKVRDKTGIQLEEEIRMIGF